MKLLVVDDQKMARSIIARHVKRTLHWNVIEASDGLEALAKLREHKPDAMTLDLEMPNMTGLEFLETVPAAQAVPILIISANASDLPEKAQSRAKLLGPHGFLSKLGWADRRAFLDALIARLTDLEQPSAQPEPPPESRPHPIRLVMVGSSTGGPPVLERILTALPSSFPVPILIAQHMPVRFTANLARRLDRVSALEVIEVTDSTALTPGMVGVAAGGRDVEVTRRFASCVTRSVAPAQVHPWHPSVDRMVASALRQYRAPSLIGIQLTGLGNDGAETFAEVHHGGGFTIAQSLETAVATGMPDSLCRLGGASVVVDDKDVAATLLGAIAPQSEVA